MKNVKLDFLLIFFLIFGLSYQGRADCPPFVKSNTDIESGGKKVWDGIKAIFTFGTKGSFQVDEKLYHYIRVNAIKGQGVGGYFDPKIEVCDYEGNGCRQLYTHSRDLDDRPGCNKIYGTQKTGAGVSAAVFIDWEGDQALAGGKFKEGIAEGLEWEWANGVTKEEQEKFANSPKICACSQKGACMSGASEYFARVGQGENIFRPGEMKKVCDTCSWGSRGRQKIKCAPVPLAPGPPPFCAQLGMSPPQVRVVPITNNDNDYFDPKVKVIIGNLKDENGEVGKKVDFPKEYGKDKAKGLSILDEGHTEHYFQTYKEKDKLCAEYYGTQGIDKKNLQFSRCFPAPHAPEPEIVEIVDENTLKIKIKMSKKICDTQGNRNYHNGFCTFTIDNNQRKVGHLLLKVIKPKIIEKTTDSSDKRSDIDDMLEKVLGKSKNEDFKILNKYGYVPDIQVGCTGSQTFYDLKDFNEEKIKECKLDSLGQPEIEIRYRKNSKSKMLCLSGWKPEPEEFVLKRGDEIISLKSMGASYAQYNTVYSKESNKSYYFPRNETIDLLANKLQGELDEIIFNKRGYVSIPEENKKRDNCIVTKTDEMDAKDRNNCKIVYELREHEEKCNQGNNHCTCPVGQPSCSTQYVDKKSNQPFYFDEQKETPIKANRTEVFYADRLCKFDLEGLKKRLREIIIRQLKDKKRKLESADSGFFDFSGQNKYTNNLSQYDYVEIEAWGGGEAGHIQDEERATENRSGMPGDYIQAKLKIDPSYPIIRVKVTEGGGNREMIRSDKNGGPTVIEMCDLKKQNCRPLITVAGGGDNKEAWEEKETVLHREDLKLEEKIIKGDQQQSTEDNKIAYIKDGEVKYKTVTECNKSYTNRTYGAGGCIDQNGTGYSKGAPGYVKIKPVLKIDEGKMKDTIENIVQSPDNKGISIDDPQIIETIEKEIRRELSGV